MLFFVNCRELKPDLMHQPLVKIRKPCHESLEARKPGAQGNYCKSCRITVTDFTDKTPAEISHYLMNHEVHCGTFSRKDVSTGGFSQKLIAYFQSRQFKFATVILTSLILFFSCRTRRGKLDAYAANTHKNNTPSTELSTHASINSHIQ